MKYHLMIGEIVNGTGLEQEDARISLDAVVAKLGERLSKTVQDKVAAKLPLELKDVLSGDYAVHT